MRRACLRWATFRGADLRYAVLDKADLHEADLEGADIRNADLPPGSGWGADLSARINTGNARPATEVRGSYADYALEFPDANPVAG